MPLPNWQRTIVDDAGNVVEGASVQVLLEATGSPPTNIYTNRNGTVTKANPFLTDATGFAEFFAEPGVYRIVVTFGGDDVTWQFESLLDTDSAPTWTDVVTFSQPPVIPNGVAAADAVAVGQVLDISQQDAWSTGVSYNEGDLVSRSTITFVSATNSNVDNDPVVPANKDEWYAPPTIPELLHLANTGRDVLGEGHPIHDLESAGYLQHLRINRATLGGVEYDFYLVHLDGTQIDGDAELEDIFDDAGANEYPYIDVYAPEELGTRTLLDLRGKFARAQTDSGEMDTLGQVEDDQMQRITGKVQSDVNTNTLRADPVLEGAFDQTIDNEGVGQYVSVTPSTGGHNLTFNSSTSPDARASATTAGETRPAAVALGQHYIIVQRAVTGS